MAYLDNFHQTVGETIMECQRIEHDIKLIYAGMVRGDWAENVNAVKNKTLGEVLYDLEILDNSDGAPCLTRSDYRLLREIKNVRNWLAHRAYMDFMYESGNNWQEHFKESSEKLLRFNERMKSLGNQVEQVRLAIMKRYGRI